MNIVFFGSFQTYSVQVLNVLAKYFHVVAVVTTPAKPQGRNLTISPTPVEICARSRNIPVYPLERLNAIPHDMEKPDFFIVAGYGKRIPVSWLAFPKIMAINAHQSLLPYYRGRFPAEWAILRKEHKTGVTLLKMSPTFDTGEIIAQQSLPIHPDDTRQTLYQKLYDLSGDLLVEYLPKIAKGIFTLREQPSGTYFYARNLTRQDGFVVWKDFVESLMHTSDLLDLKLRALSDWPGVWTTTPKGKRLILIALKPHPVVQLEGKKPVPWDQFKSVYFPQV